MTPPDALAAMLKRWLGRGKTGGKGAAAPQHATPALALERYARPDESNESPCGNVAVLNPGAVQSLKLSTQRERVDAVVRFYRSDAPRRVEAMQRALDTGDADALRRAAETLRWTSTNIGATELAACCMQLEHAARERDIDPHTARWLVPRAESLLGAVLAALDAQLLDAAA